MNITIYHNPDCGTSRNTLAMIRQSGVEPVIIEYLKNPPERVTLIQLLNDMQLTPRQLLRQNVPPYEQLNLASLEHSDEAIIDFMLEHPILINRPIVISPLGTRLCRPSEVVQEILPNPLHSFTKEDGEVIHFSGQK